MSRSRAKTADARFVADEVLVALKIVDLDTYAQLHSDLRKLPVRTLTKLAAAIDILKNGDCS